MGSANDKDEEVRLVVVESIIQFGVEKPNLVLSALVYSLHKDPKVFENSQSSNKKYNENKKYIKHIFFAML